MNKFLVASLALFLLLAVGLAKDPPKMSDDTISDAVRVKLASNQVVGVLNFSVAVQDGVVTLGGVVEQKSLSSKAESVAKKVKGVKKVINKIEIKPKSK